ncbi:uncharacterized protein N0V89_001979 [Didymosphaeria variabile]|uniref:Uncharacterized protein n=1 Tax=Didymosphaeria variabile TaxID=1932322 RepID=A0A9W8XRX2_9PLEO|nr:uncharacterized protein N0V89_001979 [Didymosphaeria variabile]KAJ4357404.1 hypothetical protein N0V89_001979 [Didymosphaeria variabile]
MARPSGLASDHHPEGPGDAPRRRKARKSTPSVDLSQNSKRPASPSGGQSSPAAKRVRMASDDHDQLAREMEESVSRAQSQTPITVRKTIIRHARRNSEPVVAFADDEEDEDEDDMQLTPSASTQPLPGLTPHLRRIGAPRGRPTNATRRARMSMPAQIRVESVDESNGSQIQFAPFKATIDSRTRRRLKRNHLAEEYNDLEYHQKEDQRLRKAYIELSNQLKEKNAQIKELEYQIEARRLGEINLTDDQTEDLREQLGRAREEIEELRASSVYRGDSRETSAFDHNMMDGAFDDDDDEPFLAIDPNDPDGPDMEDAEPLPMGEYATRVQALSSQVTVDSLRTLTQTSYDSLAEVSQMDPTSVPDRISDKAIKRYETEIDRLVEQLAEAQGALRVLSIELQNLDILAPGASTDTILAETRRVFEDLREEMENLLPGCSLGLTQAAFLRKLPTLFEGLLSELGEKTTVAEQHYQEARVMRAQYENSLGLLERSEARNDDLDNRIADLQRGNDGLRTEIADLDERVATLDALTNQQDADLKAKDSQMHGLQDEVQDKETDLTRLRDSLEKYRAELANVIETTNRTEAQFKETIAEMQQEHAAEILELQTRLQDENALHLQAQGEAEQKSEYIDELQDHIKGIEEQVTALAEDLEQLRNRLVTETEEHDQSKVLLQEEQDRVYALENQIENLEDKIEHLTAELAETHANLDAERAQREKTEVLLDEANTQIADLQERLRAEGLESQGLRSKLFQVQLEREETMKNLEEDARERESALQESIDTQTQGRQTAEQIVADLELRVTELEAAIAARDEEVARLTQELADTEKDRDEHIADLESQLADLKQKYAALENTSNSTITSLQANITDLTNEVNAQKAEIERITAEAADTERDLREELAQKEQEVAQRNQEYAELQNKYTQLEEEHTQSIETFSTEQFHFTRLQEKWIRGQQTMEEKIQTLEARIRDLEAAAAQAVLDHESAIREKETEIQQLHLLADTRAETIVEMSAQIDTLKETFAQQELDSRQTIDTLLDSQRLLQEQNEDLANSLKKRNAETLEAVQAMQVKGVVVKKQNTNLNKVANGKVTKVSERVKIGKKSRAGKIVKERKWRDSGFGADSDIENEEVDFDEPAPEAIVG